MYSRRRFLRAASTVAGAALPFVAYTWRWEPHWIEVVERPLPLANLPGALSGARVVQLSDLHIGPRVEDSYLLETFELVRKLEPDLVLYTGDFVSYTADFYAHCERMFPRMPIGRKGAFGVLGNHDYGLNWAHPEVAEKIAGLASNSGVRILRNEAFEWEGLQIIGLDDLWGGQFDLAKGLKTVAPGKACLVLNHNPDAVDEPGWNGFKGWILSGHTHGGQCKPPFLPPPLLPVKNRRYTSGPFELSGGRNLYINRGLGHLIRVRFNVRPEITLFRLMQA